MTLSQPVVLHVGPLGLCGVDEAGRGPLAGPVVAAAVMLDPQRPIDGLRDSKKLSAAKRERLADEVRRHAVAWCVAEASVAEIDRLNILHATLLAMQRAVAGLGRAPDDVWVDGNRCPDWAWRSQAVVKGDDKVAAIAAASILAKTARDQFMCSLHCFPQVCYYNQSSTNRAFKVVSSAEVQPHRYGVGVCAAKVGLGVFRQKTQELLLLKKTGKLFEVVINRTASCFSRILFCQAAECVVCLADNAVHIKKKHWNRQVAEEVFKVLKNFGVFKHARVAPVHTKKAGTGSNLLPAAVMAAAHRPCLFCSPCFSIVM